MIASGATAVTAASACQTCFIGAASTILHSFPYEVEVVTVDVVPHVTVIPGISTTTAYQSSTAGPKYPDAVTTFWNDDDLTWTVGDATLTYPTTYLQYANFQGVAAHGSQTCAERSAASVLSLSEGAMDEASLIYPVKAQQDANGQLPLQLLDYLQTLPGISSQFGGAALTACAPLSAAPAVPANAIAQAGAPTKATAQNGVAPTGVPAHPTLSPLPKLAIAHAPTDTHKTAVVVSINTGKPVVTKKKPSPKKHPKHKQRAP